ncbi:MAG: hypothetical protein RLZZ241_1203 [Bacteroidota bacterium]|jgi:hypothetical protein
MKKTEIYYPIAIVLLLSVSMAKAQATATSDLYQTLFELDSTYFEAYNTCNLDVQAKILDDELEFYHDMGGLSTSKTEILESIKNNICGKVTRELIPGSFEVHEINEFGAVAMGLHQFQNKEEPNAIPKPSKFVSIWKKSDSRWTMYRIISLH